ncbi:MAG: DUF302 domain-containing protein [Aquificae bacterium]|nr:DUF302 domain-containing protein [Aquificota bacterium]
MKRALGIGVIIGLVIGVFITPLFFKLSFKTAFFKEVVSPYDFEKTVSIIVNRINNQPGWHVVSVIDQREEILKYGGEDVGNVKIIKFCNAKYASQMLKNDDTKYMAVKMPLSIAVVEKSDGRVVVALMNGYLMSRMYAGTYEGEIMEKVVRDIEKIMGFVHFRWTIF